MLSATIAAGSESGRPELSGERVVPDRFLDKPALGRVLKDV